MPSELTLNRLKLNTLITRIRESHIDMVALYTRGQCYNFALILQSQFPEGEIWYAYAEGHVYFKCFDYWWDINGCHRKCPNKCEPMDYDRPHKPHRWGNSDNRRLLEV